MYSIFKTFVLSLLMIAQVHFAYAQNAAILPPAKTTFLDSNGKPLTSGTVDFYVPGTSTHKTTWQDQAATIANANPVVLDAAGRALILGNGSYRQVVKDRVGNIVWDQVTNSAGAGGSGNITVGDGNAVGTVLPYSGLVAPSNYAFPYGQELSRTTYSQLLNAISLTQNITCISGNPTITTIADTTQLNIGAAVEAACIPAGATIISKTVSTVTLSANASVSVTTTGTFFPWGNGNGLTTFNAPDLRGVVLPGRNNMGGSTSVNLSSPYYTDPNSIAGRGGAQSHTILTSELASHNHSITDPGHTHLETGSPAGGASNSVFVPNNGTSGVPQTSVNSTTSTTTGITINATGGGIAVSATVAAGGSGYTAGTQLLTLVGGTCTTQPQFNITTSAGAITAPVLVTAGDCSVVPSNPISTTGGGGTLGTLNVTWSARPISIVQPSKTINYIVKILADVNLSIARCVNLIDAGTACTYNIGTSGNTIPLNNTANSFSAAQTFSAGVAVSGGTTSITGLTTPTTPTDAATKAYVDSVATGLNILSQSRLASATVLPNAPTYANGAAGVGATLTAGSNTTLTVDGTLANLNDIILVKNQASAFQNGVYTVTTAGGGVPWVLTRATYFDQAAEMKAGSYTLVTAGATNIGTSWALQTAVTTVGTDPLNWIQFSATAGVTSVGGFNGIVTAAQVTSSCNLFTGALSGCVPSGAGTTTVSQLNPTTQTWVVPTAVTLQSRATAASLNLTGVNAVRTLGYATAGDGGGAVFQKIAGNFKDSYLTAATIAAGSGYVNGTYDTIPLTGGSSFGCSGRVVVAGGVVTQVLISIPCAGYAVGDVLSTVNSFLGGGTGFTYTITAMSTPQGSFTDSSGNKFQYVVDDGAFPNVRQFGAKLDWNGVDGSATNDRPAFMSAIAMAAIPFSTAGAIVYGNTIIVPKGNALICGGSNGAVLPVPQGTTIKGAGAYGASVLKLCTAESSANHFIQLCDIYTNAGQFGCAIKDIALIADGTSNANIAAIYSISGQQFPLVDNVYIQPGTRGCIFYDFGKGGAANAIFQNFDCETDTAITNSSFFIGTNVGGTQVILDNAVFGCAPTLCTHTAVTVNGAAEFHMSKVHIEGTSHGILMQNTGTSSLRNINMVSPCTTALTISAANPNGILLVEQLNAASCTNTVVNGHGGGASISGSNIILQRIFNP